jgi:hypothetical protein
MVDPDDRKLARALYRFRPPALWRAVPLCRVGGARSEPCDASSLTDDRGSTDGAGPGHHRMVCSVAGSICVRSIRSSRVTGS